MRTLRPYFEQSIPAIVAAKKTGFNVKTVNQYYKDWIDEIIKAETPDFLERSKQNKQRALLVYDNQLAVLYDAQDTAAKQIKVAVLSSKSDQVDKHNRTLAKISESIVNITAVRLNLENTVTAGEILDLDKKEEKKDGL